MNVEPWPSPGLDARTDAAVQFREALHDRQAEAEAAMPASRRGVFLTEALEDEWQERGRDADARVLHDDFGV